jgi:hypothetical protein
MTDRIESLLEQILTELKTMNERSDKVMRESEKQKAMSENMLNNLKNMMPEPMKGMFKGGIDGN